ncbi:MAG TPA: hypothetical protein VKS22_04235 [Candidatus Binataceae bacterium]|nr:hypothetical protein [Candidatus Binataceae bacterium]
MENHIDTGGSGHLNGNGKGKHAAVNIAVPTPKKPARESTKRRRKASNAGDSNAIGVLGDVATKVAVTSHEYYRAAREEALYARVQARTGEECTNYDYCDNVAETAEAKARFMLALMSLHECLSTQGLAVKDVYKVIIDADDCRGAFELCGEWHACAELAAKADNDDLPTQEQVVELIGRTEILIERIQAFFEKEGIQPDHFRR